MIADYLRQIADDVQGGLSYGPGWSLGDEEGEVKVEGDEEGN